MAWWAWLIIWTVLVLGLVAMLVLMGLRLWRKLRATLAALEELGEKVARLTENVEQLAPEPPTDRAVLLGYATVARQHDRHRERRDELRDARREARLARGKLLINPPTVPTLRSQTNAR